MAFFSRRKYKKPIDKSRKICDNINKGIFRESNLHHSINDVISLSPHIVRGVKTSPPCRHEYSTTIKAASQHSRGISKRGSRLIISDTLRGFEVFDHDKGVKMKLFKQTIAVILAAAVMGSTAITAHASPAGAGDPTGAELLLSPNDPGGTAAHNTSEISDKVFEPVDPQHLTWWDGKSELKENKDYYINGTVGIRDDAVLPESSTMVVGDGTTLYLFMGASLTVKGAMTVSPTAEVLASGTFSVADGGLAENYGSLKFTSGSVVNISSSFVSYSGCETAFAGKTLVYGGGQIINYGSAFIPKNAETTVTGKLQNYSSGKLYTAGSITVTVNGKLELDGFVDLQDRTRIHNSGTITLCNSVKYYTAENARVTDTQSGRFIDRRGSQPTTPTVPTRPDPTPEQLENGIKGIDVSVWQGAINWLGVALSGVKFAIIRSSSGSRVDKLFDYNITEAQRWGIKVGVYHYCYAMNPEEAREEARHFIETIKPYKIDYPVMFDFEDNSQAKLGREKLTAIAEAFLSEVKAAGYYPMIYSYKNWLELNLDMDKLSEYEVAVAEWNVEAPTYKRPYGIWQYSCKGKIFGINGDVDLDLCYKDYAKIIREGGYNHLSDFE